MTDDYDDIGTVRWFGPTWNAPVNDERAHVDTPDEPCELCDKPFDGDDRGVGVPYVGHGYCWYHLACWGQMIGVAMTEDGTYTGTTES